MGNIFNVLFQLVWHLEPPKAGLKTGRRVDSRLVIASTTSLSSGGVVLMTFFGNLGIFWMLGIKDILGTCHDLPVPRELSTFLP